MKATFSKAIAIYMNWETLNDFPLKTGTQQEYPLLCSMWCLKS